MSAISKKNNFLKTVKKFLLKNFYLVVMATIIIILLIGFFGLIKPRYEKIIGNSMFSKEQMQKDEVASGEYLNQINRLITVYNNISSDDIKKINSILPNCGSNEEIIGQIDYIIKKSGLRLNSISIKDVNSKTTKNNPKKEAEIVKNNDTLAGANQIAINIDVSGSDYKSFKNLLKAFEINSRIMNITKVDFSPTKFLLNFEIETYCF